MKKLALHLLLVTPFVTCFRARSFGSTREVHLKCPHETLFNPVPVPLSTRAKGSLSRIYSSNGNQPGSSYLDQLSKDYPVFPSSTPNNINDVSQVTPAPAPVSPGSASAASTSVGQPQSDKSAPAQSSVASTTANSDTTTTTNADGFEVSPHGFYQIRTEDDYRKLISAYPDKLIVVKFYASFCRSCKALAPKFVHVTKDEQLQGLPILWAEFPSLPTNKEVFKRIGVMTLPTIHFYDGDRGLAENFPCPPSKVPLLKKKLARFLNKRIDSNTRQLLSPEEAGETSLEPRVERTIINNELISTEHMDFLRNDLPFFQDLTDEEFDTMIQKARLLTFGPGDVIMKQGMPGTTFYVIKSGSVEMSIKSKFDDPISTPPSYLGAVVSTLRTFDYFGERSLTTGEPFAASFRSLDKARCFAFHVDIIPPSSILSKKRKATKQTIDMLNQRYVLPEDYQSPNFHNTKRDEGILELLVRFKQIRQAAKCLDYIMQNGVTWGDSGSIGRRTLLVGKLTYAQQNEFNDVFNMVDVQRRGKITLQQLREFLASAKKDGKKNGVGPEAIASMSQAAAPTNSNDENILIARDEFMGVMAEAEFYDLLRETFQELDQDKTGFVRAGDLDQILGGVRDLIGDKRHTSIIDVDDKDMLVDYEQFSKMLLGAAI